MKMKLGVLVLMASALLLVIGTAHAKNLIAVGIAGSNDYVYYWYSDGTVSSGTTSEPTKYRDFYRCNLPPNKTLIAVGIAGSNDYVYYWYSDGTVSAGTTREPRKYRDFYPCALPVAPDAPSTMSSWTDYIASGSPFDVVFDRISEPGGYTGDNDPMGSLQGGKTYTVTYNPMSKSFSCTGYAESSGKVITSIYSNANLNNKQISLWGRVYTFGEDGKVYDREFGWAGHLKEK